MKPAIQIREFRFPEDYEAVWNLWDSIEFGVRVGRSDSRAEIEKKLLRDPDLFLVAESEDQIVATVIGGFDGRRGTIYHLAVAQPYRRMGVGGSLMDELENRLRAKGCIRCYLFVTVENGVGSAFYEQRGWTPMDHLNPYAKDLIE